MTSRIDKTIARQREKIASGAYYEAHQQLRVIATRYIKQSNYNAAADILVGGATALLRAGSQQGASASGGDLAIMLVVEVYNKAEWRVTTVDDDDVEGRSRKKRLIELLHEFPSDEPTRKRFIQEMIMWSSRYGPVEWGDPDLHHAAGSVYAMDHEPYEAEKHLVLGTSQSAEILAKLEYKWYTSDEPHTAAIYASRAVFPYLFVGNVRSANKAFLIFTSQLSSSNPSLGIQDVSSTSSDIRIFPSLPLLNFISMLLLAVQRANADLFRQLTTYYAPQIQEVGLWDNALAQIGEQYFAIKVPKQVNPLLDMMGNMLFGSGSGKSTPQGKGSSKRVDAPPSSMELD